MISENIQSATEQRIVDRNRDILDNIIEAQVNAVIQKTSQPQTTTRTISAGIHL